MPDWVFRHKYDRGRLLWLFQCWDIVQTVKWEGCQCCHTYISKEYTLKFLVLRGAHHILYVSRLRVKWNPYYFLKEKQSHCRSGHTLRFPGVWGSHFSRQSAHENGKFVISSHFTPSKYSCHISVRGWVISGAYCGRKDYVKKYSADTIGNRTHDFPQCLNQLRHRVPTLLCMFLFFKLVLSLVHLF